MSKVTNYAKFIKRMKVVGSNINKEVKPNSNKRRVHSRQMVRNANHSNLEL